MAVRKLLLCEEISGETVKKVYSGQYSQVVLCTEGGDVEACRAICEFLLRHPKLITVTGRCQSAGVLIAAAGQEVLAYPGTEWLHHEASGECEGTATDMRGYAEFLTRHDAWANAFLEERTGRLACDWAADASKETVFTNAEALDWGLLDREL
jgi:ATP-dependent protease ClpP protease subunit